MGITISNGVFVLNETADENGIHKTLKTAGKFVNRNIEINVSVPSGSASINNQVIRPNIVIENPNTSHPTTYKIKTYDTYTCSPQVTAGWINSIDPVSVPIESTLSVGITRLTHELIKQSPSDNEYSVYRTSASAGYNHDVLYNDIDVYKGAMHGGTE